MKALLDRGLHHSPWLRNGALLAAGLTVALFLPAAPVRAKSRGQSGTGSVNIVVSDPLFEPIVSASVVLTDLDTNRKISGRTNAFGTYKLSSIPAGCYQFEVNEIGFRTFRSRVLDLKPSGSIVSYVSLKLGRAAQQMRVTGHRPVGPPPIKKAIQAKPVQPTNVRVGVRDGQLQKLIHSVTPVYPPSEERNGVTGTVVLHVIVGTDGKVVSVSPQSGPNRALIKSAVDAVRQWRYTPMYLNGEPVEAPRTIDIIFRLSPQSKAAH